MPEKASDIIGDALREIVVAGAEAPIEADEGQSAIRYLNRMMAEWDVRGYNLGCTVVSDLGDDITIPDGTVEAVVSNLAIRLASQFGVSIDPASALIDRARVGLRAVRLLTISVGPSSFPSTLPIGSGNEGDSTFTDHFYPDEQSKILAEPNGSILVEDDTDGES